jgi:hypothetical protein
MLSRRMFGVTPSVCRSQAKASRTEGKRTAYAPLARASTCRVGMRSDCLAILGVVSRCATNRSVDQNVWLITLT